MKKEWIKHSLWASREKADLMSGCRKILRTRTLSFYRLDDSLQMEDSGYGAHKMSSLKRGYLHEESIDVARQLWNRRRSQDKYGSVGFTTYNHFIKRDPNKGARRGSVMGPCIQSVTLTYLDRQKYSIDVFYRTTELFKKFPADLVFIRDVLLPGFDFSGMKVEELNCYFANITAHPMYAIVTVPHIPNVIDEWEKVKTLDPYFWGWLIKWSARYICPEHYRGIQKFDQAMRVKAFVDRTIRGTFRRKFIEYLSDNHPGHKREYNERETQEDDE